MEKNKCQIITYQQVTKNLFTLVDIQGGYQKKNEEKRGMKQWEGILTSLVHT